jgi:sugar-phosphatase
VIRTAHGHRSIETIALLLPDADLESENEIVEADEVNDTDGLTATEGAAELLAILPADRWTVVTSGTRPLAAVRLRVADLPEPPRMVTASEVNNGKPHPEPYLKGAAALGIAPEECLVFEDAQSGIRAAHAAGMKVIGIPGTYDADKLTEADALVSSLAHVSIEVSNHGLLVRIP